jgi:hypothetical protein
MSMARRTVGVVALGIWLVSPSLQAETCKNLKESLQGKELVLQYNFFYEDDEAHWANFFGWNQKLPIGSKVTVVSIKADEVTLLPEGHDDEIAIDFEDAESFCPAILTRLLGTSAPEISKLSKLDQQGIKQGKILEGMTRRAVFLAVGAPPQSYQPPFRDDTAENPDLDADELVFMSSTWDFVKVTFTKDLVTSIED